MIKSGLILIESGDCLIDSRSLFVHPLPKDKDKLNLRRKRSLMDCPLNWYIKLTPEDKDTIQWLINRNNINYGED